MFNKFKTVGFVGVGIMGKGMVQNLLLNDFKVNILAHRNRGVIDFLVSMGARELTSLAGIAKLSDTLILCLPNSKTVTSVLGKIFPCLKENALIIDCTADNLETVKELHFQATCRGLRYAESPLIGGKLQAETVDLGAIVGCDLEHFEDIQMILEPCCQTIERFGEIGAGATAKWVFNFLAIGTATLVVEAMKAARDYPSVS
jgi:3-hydroxyisobutyrate dehydrogenase-like beta-hydroxyacid dehydrogenase